MSSFTESFLAANMDKFPADYLPNLRHRLGGLSHQQSNIVLSTNLKSPIVALVISLFFGGFGADRFYIGQVGLGILKLITLGGLGVWSLVDWFLIMSATRTVNVETINTSLIIATGQQVRTIHG